jgi:AcrR family transcriptional regulator
MLLMSTSEKTKAYHHGNLRQALLEAARDLTAEVGIDGFTLREVARRAGVSHAAPYNHFADKAALIEALAINAFQELGNALRLAVAQHTDPLATLEEIGVAYVRFAFQHPNEFRFIFRNDLRTNSKSASNQAGERAYGILLEATKNAQSKLLHSNLELLALTAWSTSHGLATLVVNGPRQDLVNNLESVEKLARGVMRTLQEGLFRH